ncbi:MAG: hypothetical protein WBF84_11205 [Castellaniella sp.]|uniref:hypothetical protein n=1 Tax=Castellaniella sp. TaxID=1955812 RepID=UPI003C71F622
MDQAIDRRQWSGARPTPGTGQGAADIDLWLRRNVLTCSEQEYLRYRAYLETESASDEASGVPERGFR